MPGMSPWAAAAMRALWTAFWDWREEASPLLCSTLPLTCRMILELLARTWLTRHPNYTCLAVRQVQLGATLAAHCLVTSARFAILALLPTIAASEGRSTRLQVTS